MDATCLSDWGNEYFLLTYVFTYKMWASLVRGPLIIYPDSSSEAHQSTSEAAWSQHMQPDEVNEAGLPDIAICWCSEETFFPPLSMTHLPTSGQLTYQPARLWDVVGNQSTRRKPTRSQGERANSRTEPGSLVSQDSGSTHCSMVPVEGPGVRIELPTETRADKLRRSDTQSISLSSHTLNSFDAFFTAQNLKFGAFLPSLPVQ
ncbi:uncharacterized protein LOC127578978 [Pristis pectinata]|uniref:uncharacterized protein LOC127578978 n=1 Tax=Pristis pectinata TaxID=685728 RepID=UPI00223E1757|nr:uncharacterized protein LOC127578978 [Pristis pectinata]